MQGASRRPWAGRALGSAWGAAASYALLTIATTWPLTAHMTRSLPGLGDSLLNCWILSWGADHVIAWLGGNAAAFSNFWQAPLFHPSPFTLAYSEHLFAQSVEIAPVYWLTGNVIVCYNLLFLSTFVVSGVGAYLLARELTGSGPAAWVAGASYAFAMYRVAQVPHLQVLSSGWMPLVFYGLRRYFVSRRVDGLAGATAALVVQNLSNGYFLVFFPPFVALYCLYEIADRRLWRAPRVWLQLTAAAAATALATWPFVSPYLTLRTLGFAPRSMAEVVNYSADALAFVTAPPASRVWGWLYTYVHAEGELFPGLITPLLALTAVAIHGRAMWAARDRVSSTATPWRRRLVIALLVGAATLIGFTILVGVTGDPTWRIAGIRIRLHRPWLAWGLATLALAAAFILSPRLRAVVRGARGSTVAFFGAMAVLTAWMAMGPVISIAGAPTHLPSLYRPAYLFVPGFDGLRVPARFAMLLALSMAVLAGYGARALLAVRRGPALVAGLAAALVIESTAAPMQLDRGIRDRGYAPAPDHVYVGAETPAMYLAVRALPAGASLIEFPFGLKGWELQYVFYQRAHRHPIVNGYSGGAPPWYDQAVVRFQRIEDDPEGAWDELRFTGASHALLHLDAYRGGRGAIVGRWLAAHGAAVVSSGPTYRLYRLPPP